MFFSFDKHELELELEDILRVLTTLEYIPPKQIPFNPILSHLLNVFIIL